MDEKRKLLGNFAKIFKKFLRKLRKGIILAYVSKHLTSQVLNFCAFGRKSLILGNFEKFWWKFHRKIEFLFYIYFYFGKFVTKMESSEITPFFYNNFFGFVGGGASPPLATPLASRTSDAHNRYIPSLLSSLAHTYSPFSI